MVILHIPAHLCVVFMGVVIANYKGSLFLLHLFFLLLFSLQYFLLRVSARPEVSFDDAH